MSAFLCSPEHIRTITGDNTADAVLLAKANLHSLAVRYPDTAGKQAPSFLCYDSNADYLRTVRSIGTPPARSAPERLKLMLSLDYQSCEYPGWQNSRAKRQLEYYMFSAIGELPGYSEAQWSI
jgi:hypothetical protein